jgi:hypothetical protein
VAKEPTSFTLPAKIDLCLAALSKLYAQEGERSLQGIVVNAQTRLHEGYGFDYTDHSHGHALYLTVPESIYLANADQRQSAQQRIAEDLNKLHNVKDEYIEKVFLEMEVPEGSDWRQESGLLITGTRQVTPDATKRLWVDGDFRLFLSHKAEVKREAATLKDVLQYYGVSAFVAHEDIHPTKEWQDEIENALVTMDGFVALMTSGFHDSDWTDQEVGYALARGVPIIAVRLGRDPYGFLGKFQALTSKWDSAPEDIVKLLIKNDRMLSAYISALRRCPSFDTGNMLSQILPSIESASQQQIDEMINAFNANDQLQGSFGFNGTKPNTIWGRGLLPHLHRWGSRRFVRRGSEWSSRIISQSPTGFSSEGEFD